MTIFQIIAIGTAIAILWVCIGNTSGAKLTNTFLLERLLMNTPVNGRGPNGRALKKDGTERKARRNLTAAEVIAQIEEKAKASKATIGRKVFSNVPNLEQFTNGVQNFRKWIRDAKAYETEDKRAERRAYFVRQLELIDEKGSRAEKWLPGASQAIAALSDLYANIGQATIDFMTKNGREPNEDEQRAIVASLVSDDVRKIVEDANDPDNDVFAGLRRGDDTEVVGDDTL